MNPVVVINSGRPGDTTVQLLERFEARIAGFQPDLVLYWIGSNDMLYPGHTVEPPQFRANCRELAARARSIGAAVAFLTLPPLITAYLLEQFPGVADYPESATERLAIGNRLLAAQQTALIDVAATVSRRPVAETVDSYIRNQSNSGMRDGMHLTSDGCKAVAQTVASGIFEMKLPHTRVVCAGDSLTYGVYLKGKGKAEPDGETYPSELFRQLAADRR